MGLVNAFGDIALDASVQEVKAVLDSVDETAVDILVGVADVEAAVAAVETVVGGVEAAVAATFDATTYADSAPPLDAAATFTGQARDSQGKHSRVAATFLADQASAAGGCRIEISADGSTGWTALVSGQNAANTPLQLSAYLTARYWRVVMVNDASAQSSLSITSGQFKA